MGGSPILNGYLHEQEGNNHHFTFTPSGITHSSYCLGRGRTPDGLRSSVRCNEREVYDLLAGSILIAADLYMSPEEGSTYDVPRRFAAGRLK